MTRARPAGGIDRRRRWWTAALTAAALSSAAYGYWKLAVPEHRVAIRSELVMLGDLDGDRRWTGADLAAFDAFLRDPLAAPDGLAWRMDLNQNGLLDAEDRGLLEALVAAGGDPYAAEAAAVPAAPFPRPRELFRYRSLSEYRPRPLWALPYPQATDSSLRWLATLPPSTDTGTYARALDVAVRAEAIRFDQAWRRRAPRLSAAERADVAARIARVDALQAEGDRQALLLALMDLVEEEETLPAPRPGEPAARLLAFRDHLRDALASPTYAGFEAGRRPPEDVLGLVQADLARDLGVHVDLATLGPPRNLTHLQNYVDRAEWQVHKTAARERELLALIAYAQHDPRYLRAVSRTSRALQDPAVENHQLPMVLLFREALRLEHGDKKAAVGLLDEAIRVPYAWIKAIPREALPGSLAYDNFLLPGNKEDGADKSRHWNVFGGVCLYKSPEEALDLALRREVQDLREARYAPAAMREFFRDLIADVNGMVHVMSVDPDLLRRAPPAPPVDERARAIGRAEPGPSPRRPRPAGRRTAARPPRPPPSPRRRASRTPRRRR